MTRWARLPRWSRAVVAVLVVGFLVGTTTHVVDLTVHGSGVYPLAPDPLRWFLVLLTVLDPLAAVLIGTLRRAGVLLACGIMLVDVPANWFLLSRAWEVGAGDWAKVGLQTAFGVVVLVTAVPLWSAFRPGPASPRAP